MDQNEQFMPDFWKQYQQFVNKPEISPATDLPKGNDKEQVQPLNLSCFYFLPFAIPGELCDVPHIGHRTDKGEVFFYLPRAHCKRDAIRMIVRSYSALIGARETAHIQVQGAKRDIKLLIQIPPVQTMKKEASQASVKLAYEKMLKLFHIARKALPEYKLK